MESLHPRIRVLPEDFVVDEVALYPATGTGSHTFVRVEKCLRNTDDVIRDLAREAGVAPRHVGCAGRKDRRAITRQWFSLPDVDPEVAVGFELDGARVLEAVRHPHKLRTGHLAANRFEIWVREVSPDLARAAGGRLEAMTLVGMPNRFGAQRFGRHATNLERGRAILMGSGRSRDDRRTARFMVSALQSAVFNEALERRPLPLDCVEEGDVAMVAGSGGAFLVEDAERENLRAARFEISPTGPIFGKRMMRAGGAVALREAAAMQALGLPPLDELRSPRGIRMAGARRALRVRPEGVKFEVSPDEATVRLQFELPPGSYATVLLEELFGELEEGPPKSTDDRPTGTDVER